MSTLKSRLAALERVASSLMPPEPVAVVIWPIEQTEHSRITSEILEHKTAGRRVILIRTVDGKVGAASPEPLPEVIRLALGG